MSYAWTDALLLIGALVLPLLPAVAFAWHRRPGRREPNAKDH